MELRAIIWCFSLIVLLLINPSESKKKASDYFTLCKRSDPELSKCFLNSALAAQPQLIKGIPELKLPPIDPLFVEKISMNQGEKNFQMYFTMTNMTIKGMTKTEYSDFKVDSGITRMSYTTFSKVIHMDGNYEMDGKVLVLPVKGNGKAIFDFYNVTTKATLKFGRFEKKGQKYIKCESYDLKIEPGMVKTHLSNLFNGDKVLGESTNKFFNENWKDTFGAYKKLPEEAFAGVLKGYFNSAISSFPEKDWFLD